MDCHKCKKEMTMTPVCIHCGDIPIAEASFKALEDKIKELEDIINRNGKALQMLVDEYTLKPYKEI